MVPETPEMTKTPPKNTLGFWQACIRNDGNSFHSMARFGPYFSVDCKDLSGLEVSTNSGRRSAGFVGLSSSSSMAMHSKPKSKMSIKQRLFMISSSRVAAFFTPDFYKRNELP